MSEIDSLLNQDYGYYVRSGSPEIKKVKVTHWGSRSSETIFYDLEYGLDEKYYKTFLMSSLSLGGGFVAKTKQEALDWLILDTAKQFTHYEQRAKKFKKYLLELNDLKHKLKSVRENFDLYFQSYSNESLPENATEIFSDLCAAFNWDDAEKAELNDIFQAFIKTL